MQEEIRTGGTERAPYVSTDASASQSSQPQPSSPLLPLFLLHKQNPKNPLLQLMLPLGLLKQSELAGQIRIPSDNFFTLITSEHHIKLFIAIPTLKPSSQGCQERRKKTSVKMAEPDMVASTWDPSPLEAEAGGSLIQTPQ